MATRRKPRKPKRQFPYIAAVYSGGKWQWRAQVMQDGKIVAGPLRDGLDAQADAYRDAEKLRASYRPRSQRIETFEDAIALLVSEARALGASELNIKKGVKAQAAQLDRAGLDFEARLADFTIADTKRLIFWMIEHDYSPNTIRQKTVPFINRLFDAAELDSPAKSREVRMLLRSRIKYVPPAPKFYDLEEIRTLIHRMRTEEFHYAKDHPKAGQVIKVRSRERDADLVEFFASSGVRPGELERVMLTDVDLKRLAIAIREPKDRGNPRRIEITDNLVPIVTRMVAHAKHKEWDHLLPTAMNTLNQLAARWKKRLGDKKLSARTLRHTFGTGLLYSGAEIGEAKGLLGHKHLSTTSRYVHEVTSRRRAAADRWNSRLSGTQGGEASSPPSTSPDTSQSPDATSGSDPSQAS